MDTHSESSQVIKQAKRMNSPTRPYEKSGVTPLSKGLILMGVMAAVFWFVHAWGYWEDDAFIHLEYARSVFQGHGFMFNGHVSNGDTSPLWVLLLALSRALISNDWIVSGKVLTAVSATLCLYTLYRFSKSLSESGGGAQAYPPALLLVIFTINPYYAYWAYSGMEALLGSAFLLIVCMRVTDDRASYAATLGSALLLGLTPLLRPEMVLLVVSAAPFLVWRSLVLSREEATGSRLLKLALIGVALSLPLAIWSAYALHAFGYVAPNTNAAKRAAPGTSVVLRLLEVWGMGFPSALAVTLLAPILFLKAKLISSSPTDSNARLTSLAAALPRATWPLIAYAVLTTLFYIVNHTYVQTRYIVVLGPGLLAVALHLASQNESRLQKIAFTLLSACPLFFTITQAYPLIQNKVKNDADIAEMCHFINDHIDAKAKIAVYSIGEYGFMIKQSLIDTGGITQPEAAAYLWSPDEMSKWVSRQGAKYYISSDIPAPAAVAIHSLSTPSIGWSFDPNFYAREVPLRLWKLAD